jgi:hypothetical protein
MNYRDYIADPARACAVVVHRGLWRAAPENSLLAIERAIVGGYPVVEIDIRRTADGELVLLHDDTLLRMTGVDRRPEDMTLQQLQALRLRDRNGGAANPITAEHVPTLREVFGLTRDRIFIHLDVKRREVIPDALACAESMGVIQQVDIWGDLRSAGDVHWYRDVIEPSGVLFMPRIKFSAPDAAEQLDFVADVSPAVCEIAFRTLDDVDAVRLRLGAGAALWCNTLDDVASPGFTDTAALTDPDAVWGALIDAGVSVIQTDQAALLKTYTVGAQR